MNKVSWRVKLIGLFVLILSASLLFQLLYIIPHVRDREVETTQTEQQHVGRSIGRELDLGLQRIENELVRIAQQPEFSNMEIAKQGQVMNRIIGILPDMSSLFAMDAEGWFVSSNVDDLSAYTTKSYVDQGFFDIALNKGKTYFGVPIFYPQIGFVGVSISVPITSDTGRRVGVLIGGLVLNDLMEFVANYPLNEGMVAFLVDKEGTVVAYSGMNLFALKEGPLSLNYCDQPLVRAIREGKKEGSQEYDQEGTSYFGSYTTLKSNDWGVVVETPLPIILAKSNELARQLVLINVILFAATLVILLVFTQQITSQRHKIEKALTEERNLLQALIDNIPDSIYFKDDKNQVIKVNKARADVSGTTPEKMIGKTDFDFFPEEEAKKAFADDNQIMESNKSLTDRAEKITDADGKKHWFSVIKIPRHNEKGQVIGTMGISRDITERKRAEEERKKLMLELKRSNQELEQFAYVASHDLQEPLRMIVSYLQLLSRRYQGKIDADADEFIGYAVDGGRRLQRMISDLLIYSRVGTRGKEFVPINCEDVLKEVLGSLQIAIEESAATITHDPLPTVMADATQLAQLLQNLIANAIKYRGKNSPLIHLGVQSQNNEWLFSAKDNGIGLDPKYSERIFGVFQRLHTREEYAGTGIGLAVCQRIVERHGGRIWVKSELGKGSTFYFTIPMVVSKILSRNRRRTL